MSVVSCRSIDDFAYPVFREYSSLGHCIHIFNTEYRIHKAMESIEQDDIAKKKYSQATILRILLEAANGQCAKRIALRPVLAHIQEFALPPCGEQPITLTLLAWKPYRGKIVCSAELLYLSWEKNLSFSENLLQNAYFRNAKQTAAKLWYFPAAVVGKGNYVQSFQKLFSENPDYYLV